MSCRVGVGGSAACCGAAGSPLTGAGPRSQRGLESPGAEVGRCSLKDEGHRQGDKHGPLSTWWPLLFFVFYLSLTFSSPPVCRPAVVLWPVSACFLFVCFFPVCAAAGEDGRRRRKYLEYLAFFSSAPQTIHISL